MPCMASISAGDLARDVPSSYCHPSYWHPSRQVLVFMIDATSRAHFRRSMPQTLAALQAIARYGRRAAEVMATRAQRAAAAAAAAGDTSAAQAAGEGGHDGGRGEEIHDADTDGQVHVFDFERYNVIGYRLLHVHAHAHAIVIAAQPHAHARAHAQVQLNAQPTAALLRRFAGRAPWPQRRAVRLGYVQEARRRDNDGRGDPRQLPIFHDDRECGMAYGDVSAEQ